MLKLTSFTLMAMLVLAITVPALAQPSNVQDQLDDTAVLTFEVYTTGQISEDTTFFAGYAGAEFGLTTLQLTDPDGDGTYSGSVTLYRGQKYEVRIIQGTGTEISPPAGGSVKIPGEPSQLLLDIQTITLDKDKIVSASYSGAPIDPGNTGKQYTNGQADDVTLSFALNVEGECSEETTFFTEYDLVGAADFIGTERLTDPDGDGVYTVTAEYPVGSQVDNLLIVRGTGTIEVPFLGGTFEAPGEPITVVESFDPITLDDDTTLSASTSCEGGSEKHGLTTLPDTGGMSAIFLGGGALLIAVGLTALRIADAN